MLRLFAGIEIGPPARDRLIETLGFLRQSAPVKWTRDENLHITTKFIGAWPEDRVEEVVEALRGVNFAESFAIGVGPMGYFPNAQSPRVLVAHVAECELLRQLVARTESALAALGVAREERPYTPHITLARIRRGTAIQNLRSAVARQPADFGTFQTSESHLYRSANSLYTKIMTFPVH